MFSWLDLIIEFCGFRRVFHGSIGLESNTNVHYKAAECYAKNSEAVLRWNDSQVAILWPKFENLIISQKDQRALMLSLSSETAR